MWNLFGLIVNILLMCWMLVLGNPYVACFNAFAAGTCFTSIVQELM